MANSKSWRLGGNEEMRLIQNESKSAEIFVISGKKADVEFQAPNSKKL